MYNYASSLRLVVQKAFEYAQRGYSVELYRIHEPTTCFRIRLENSRVLAEVSVWERGDTCMHVVDLALAQIDKTPLGGFVLNRIDLRLDLDGQDLLETEFFCLIDRIDHRV